MTVPFHIQTVGVVAGVSLIGHGMYLTLDHELVVVQVAVIRCNAEIVTHVLAAQALLTGHQGLIELLAVTSSDDVGAGIAEELLDSLSQIADGRGIRLLDEQVAGIGVLEGEHNQIHSLVQIHQEAGHVGSVMVMGLPAMIWSMNRGMTEPRLHMTLP